MLADVDDRGQRVLDPIGSGVEVALAQYRDDRASVDPHRRLFCAGASGRKSGLLLATVVGIVGALLGGFLAKALFHVQTLNTFFNLSTWITAIVGAVILFLLMRAVSGSRRGRRA